MGKIALLGATALRSAVFIGVAAGFSTVAGAQAANTAPPAPAAQQEACDPNSPTYDPNTGNCVQPAEGEPGSPAPGTNPGTAPSDEEPAVAEAAPAGDNQEVIVTGSRIPRPQFEGTIPGAQVTQEQITTRAFTSALEALNDIPLVGPGASPFGTNGGQPGSLGAAFVDLLDLGTNRTLTLVNGRRFVSGNQGTLFVSGNVTGSQVDLNVIPTALISRFDVLTVGGAAAYGSDAIAGVVNAILIDDYDGFQVGGVVGVTERGDGFNYRTTFLAGKNLFDDRANITVSYERIFDDGLTADARPEYLRNPIAPTFFGNGGVRNDEFTATVPIGAAPFLPAFSDQIPGNIAGDGIFGGSILLSRGGVIFANPGTLGATVTQGPFTTVPGITPSTGSPIVGASVAGNAQIIPGVPVAAVLAGCSVTNLSTFCNFAPTALPTGTAAQQTAFAQAVITQYAPTLAATGTQAQRNALAVQLLQDNLPTPREYFEANPNTDPNLFIGRFLTFQQATTTPAFLTVANTDPLTSGFFPRRAVPLAFADDGSLIDVTGCITPDSPATAGGTPCSNVFQNPSQFTVLRTEQKRDIGNLFAHFDITDSLTVYTEGLYARVKTISPQNAVASSNAIPNTTAENPALLMSVNNPFLSAEARNVLVNQVGLSPTTGTFLLSRTNQDLAPGGKNPITNLSDTYRLVGGMKGDFNLLGQNHRFDTSLTWGRNDASYTRIGLLDVEYALAVDAVADPITGQIVCRSQIDRAGALGSRDLPRGINAVDIIRVRQSDGSYKEVLQVRSVTDAQIAACQPFNAFGFGQASDAARDYVTGETVFENRNDQLFAQASLAGSLFRVPGGPLGYAISADYRKDKIDFRVDEEFSAVGRTRSAVLARTEGEVENYEIGIEARIPIFGDDFNIPLFRNLDFTPAMRWVKQTGDAPDVELLNGDVRTNKVNTGWNRIWSLAGSWRPVRDITVRGNITRSLRQPSVVELFLGGQPAFNAYTDPCDRTRIGGGNTPDLRRANCRAAVIAAGFATDDAGADTFLASFTNPGNAITGSFNGSPDLQPERGRSWTVGVAANPSFIPGLRLSADYIEVKLLDRIVPTTLTNALQICFDSPTFPDTSPQVGVNTCTFGTRATAADVGQPAFILQNGFTSGFINLGALQVNAINATASYDVPIDKWIGGNVGNLELYANVYHLIHYKTASNGNLNDRNVVFDFAGSASNPDWEVQGRVRYEHPGGAYGQWTTNWQGATCAIGSADVCATNEEFDLLKIPAITTHDLSLGYRFGEERRFSIQLAIANVFDKRYVVNSAQAIALGIGGGVDTFGRRYRLSTTLRF